MSGFLGLNRLKYTPLPNPLVKKKNVHINRAIFSAQSTTDECALAGVVTTCIVEEAQKVRSVFQMFFIFMILL